MSQLLPQQRLFLELIVMSGDVEIPSQDNGTMMYRTLKECEKLRWVTIAPSSTGMGVVSVTRAGRKML